MKYISICSGIEAATTAWHGLGWEPLAFSEIDAFPSAVLAERYPQVPNLGDMSKYREWPEELMADCELLVGGTPCQAFSVAGLRKSLDDERGNLSLIYVQLFHHINEIRRKHGRSPAIALWENVPGVLSTKDNAFGCFVSGLLGVDDTVEVEGGKWPKAGFLGSETVRVGYRILDAQYFAVAQRRRRVFLAAVPCELVERFGERACPSEILSLRESVLGNPPTRGAAWEGVARATAAGPTSSGRGVERPGESRGQDDVVICTREREREREHPAVARSLTARMHKGFDSTLDSQTPIVTHGGVFDGEPTCFHPTQDPICSTDGSAHAMGTGSKGGCSSHAVCVTGHRTHALTTRAAACEEDGTGRGPPAVAFKPSHFTRGKDGKPSEVTPPLSADADKGDQDTIVASPFTKAKRAQSSSDDESWVPGEVAPTQNQFDQGEAQPMCVRRLTAKECEFLQGFPENYTLVTYRKKPAADGPRYRALGNSMAVPCMAWLGWRIHKATGGDK